MNISHGSENKKATAKTQNENLIFNTQTAHFTSYERDKINLEICVDFYSLINLTIW